MKRRMCNLLTIAALMVATSSGVAGWETRSFSGAKVRFQGVSPADNWFYIEQTGPSEGLRIGWPSDPSPYDADWQLIPSTSTLTLFDSYYGSDITVTPGESWKLGTFWFVNGFNAGESTTPNLAATMTLEISGTEQPSGYYDVHGVWQELASGEFYESDSWSLGIYQDPVGDDAVYLIDHPELGYFYVPEGKEGLLDVYATFGSIDPVRFEVNGAVGRIGTAPSSVPDGGGLASVFACVCAGLFAARRRFNC